MSANKTAVVLIHGMGEQRPMETLPDFVDAVWCNDGNLVHPSRATVFSKPDHVSSSFELRRMTTRQASAGPKKRVDFFEFYWAHHMQGHTVQAVLLWAKRLILRKPSDVPPELKGIWRFSLSMIFIACLLLGLWIAPDFGLPFGLSGWPAAVMGILVGIVGVWFPAGILPRIGDAARYLDASPGNVALRQEVRSEGVALLEDLARRGSYDRIVIVAHSLGTAIAYDIVNFLWNRLEDQAMSTTHAPDSAAALALAEVEIAGLALRDASEAEIGARRVAYREAQRRYFATLSASDSPLWLISDLVTLGSPLSKADVLVARTPGEFELRKSRRELPSSPPVFEQDGDTEHFSFSKKGGSRRPHHAAPLSATVWTNIYVPHRLLVLGDVVSGAVAPKFGRGIVDVELQIGNPPGFRHNNYWRAKAPDTAEETLTALRSAVNLAEKREEADIWGSQEAQSPIHGKDIT